MSKNTFISIFFARHFFLDSPHHWKVELTNLDKVILPILHIGVVAFLCFIFSSSLRILGSGIANVSTG